MKEVLLVGAGYMAREYAKVLHGLKHSFVVVGNGETSAKQFEQETGEPVICGGLAAYLQKQSTLPKYAIVAVGFRQLYEAAGLLLRAGAKHILLEKPGGLCLPEFQKLQCLTEKLHAEVSIAYNRRFYASTRAAKRFIAEDGEVESFNFEFTEWLHVFEEQGTLKEILPVLLLANSSHVMDLAFFLGGNPVRWSCFHKESSKWRGQYTAFSGSGVTDKQSLFSYQANWEAPGRWSVEVSTRNRRLIFRPLEKLQVQKIKSVHIDLVDIDYTLDETYKPGLYLQTRAFIEHDDLFQDLCSLKMQTELMSIYQDMAGCKSLMNGDV